MTMNDRASQADARSSRPPVRRARRQRRAGIGTSDRGGLLAAGKPGGTILLAVELNGPSPMPKITRYSTSSEVKPNAAAVMPQNTDQDHRQDSEQFRPDAVGRPPPTKQNGA